MRVRTAGLTVSVVNDAPGYYVPLLIFSVPRLTFKLDGASEVHMHMRAHTRAALNADCKQTSNFN